MAANLLFINSDMDLQYGGARPARNPTVYLNAGTCTYAVKTTAEVAVGTGTLPYVADSDGDYYGVIDAAITALLTNGSPYYVDITFVEGTYNDSRRIRAVAMYRRATD